MFPIKDVTGADLAFGGNISELMLAYKDLPAEYRDERTPSCDFISHWFFRGLKNPEFVPKDGVDPNKALTHISAILRSWEPKHEHKVAGCAFLLDEWFEKYEDKAK